MQFVFRHPGISIKTCAGLIAPKLDVKGDGGVTALPPTPGRVWEVPLPDDLAQLPQPPRWVIQGLVDAARVSGVSEATIYRWKREDPAFRDALRAARRDALDQARRGLEDLAQTASQTLKEVMEDRKAPATARVAAARSVWQLVDQGHDVDEIEDLIEELRGDLDD